MQGQQLQGPMPHWKRYLMALVISFTAVPASAEIYRWVDHKGVTHYSDAPPDQQSDSEPIDSTLPPLHRMQRPSAKLTQIQQRANQQRRAASSPVASRSKRQASAGMASRCSGWQRQLDKIQSQLRRGYSEPRGNKLRQRRRELKELYNNNCR